MTGLKNVAVIDIGKTNVKLVMVDLQTMAEICVITRPNKVLPGPPWPHFDVDGHWTFLLSGLKNFHQRFGVEAISITTHAACVVLLDYQGQLAAPILDYEHDELDVDADEYNAMRPPFSETGSPRLAGGLNVGAQLHWQFKKDSKLLSRVKSIVTYPQYWAHRLTGVAAVDVTSIGCHTDLWNPTAGKFSTLVNRLGIGSKMAEVRRPDDVLGPILQEIAVRTGLPANTQVVCGIHDSNASLLPHIISKSAPFSVVSTGTWVIAMAIGGAKTQLDSKGENFINVNAFGDPVPSSRFMGGREFELIQRGAQPCADESDMQAVLEENIMLFPAVETSSGPYKGREMNWEPSEPEFASGTREVCLSFYLALMTAKCLQNIGAKGSIVIEGPFARNYFYRLMLEAVTGERILSSASATGTSIGAAMLLQRYPAQMFDRQPQKENTPMLDVLKAYATRWKSHVECENKV